MASKEAIRSSRCVQSSWFSRNACGGSLHFRAFFLFLKDVCQEAVIRETGSDGSTMPSRPGASVDGFPCERVKREKKKWEWKVFLQFHQMSKIGFSPPYADNRRPGRCHQSGRGGERGEKKEGDTGLRKWNPGRNEMMREWWSERKMNRQRRPHF